MSLPVQTIVTIIGVVLSVTVGIPSAALALWQCYTSRKDMARRVDSDVEQGGEYMVDEVLPEPC